MPLQVLLTVAGQVLARAVLLVAAAFKPEHAPILPHKMGEPTVSAQALKPAIPSLAPLTVAGQVLAHALSLAAAASKPEHAPIPPHNTGEPRAAV